MAKSPPERLNVSIPEDHELSKQLIQELVDETDDVSSVSELVRRALEDVADVQDGPDGGV